MELGRSWREDVHLPHVRRPRLTAAPLREGREDTGLGAFTWGTPVENKERGFGLVFLPFYEFFISVFSLFVFLFRPSFVGFWPFRFSQSRCYKQRRKREKEEVGILL